MSHIAFDAVTVVGDDGGSAPILSQITADLTEERIALIGANGSGKSTLARTINGLVEPTSGTVTVNGNDVAKHGRAVRRQVGFVFTDPTAQLVMPTVVEDIALSLRRQYPRSAERDRAAREVLADFGLTHLADRSVYTLSGGQRQLVALAGVLAVQPQIVVADEPTTLLDLRNALDIADRLLGLTQQLVVATHDLDLAARCDRVLWIDDGELRADGPPKATIDAYRAHIVGTR